MIFNQFGRKIATCHLNNYSGFRIFLLCLCWALEIWFHGFKCLLISYWAFQTKRPFNFDRVVRRFPFDLAKSTDEGSKKGLSILRNVSTFDCHLLYFLCQRDESPSVIIVASRVHRRRVYVGSCASESIHLLTGVTTTSSIDQSLIRWF